MGDRERRDLLMWPPYCEREMKRSREKYKEREGRERNGRGRERDRLGFTYFP
jgi:hypothetical protein